MIQSDNKAEGAGVATDPNEVPAGAPRGAEDRATAVEPEAQQPAEAAGRVPRKERVLHTRVPAVLEQELKRLAGSLRVPVSNVVRTILEDAVDTIDSVGQLAEGELRGVADMLSRHRRRYRGTDPEPPSPPSAADPAPPPDVVAPLAGVVGYQLLLLARRESCGLCGKPMEVGSQAYLGVRRSPAGKRVIVCQECLPFSAAPSAASQPNEEPNDE